MVDLMSLALGVVAVLIVLGVVIMFYVVNQVFLLKKKFGHLEKVTQDNHDFLHRRIDESNRNSEQMVMRSHNHIDEVEKQLISMIDESKRNLEQMVVQSHNHTDEVEKQLISMIDSRLDKLENKIIQKQVL
jgi:uncharacterized membrane protein YhiD involved in acid resistance